jgi:hypothetical protein
MAFRSSSSSHHAAADVENHGANYQHNLSFSNTSRMEDSLYCTRTSTTSAEIAILDNLRTQEKAALLSDISARDRSLREMQAMLDSQEDQRRERQLLDISRGKFLAAALVIQVHTYTYTHIYVHTHIHYAGTLHKFFVWLHTCIRFTDTRSGHTHTHTHTHARTHAHIHTRMYTDELC